MADDLQVKGTSIRSKLAYVREHFGEAAERALSDDLAAAGVRQVLDSSWYPFDLFERLLRTIAERHFNGELTRLQEIGRYSAEHALTTTYAFYGHQQDFDPFVRRLPTLHGRFYSRGTLEVEHRPQAASCAIRLRGAGRYADADLYVAQGFYIGAAARLGLRDPRCPFQRVDDGVDFTLAWTPAADA